MASDKWKIITVVVCAVAIPLTIFLWWETYKIALRWGMMTGFITNTVFGVVLSVGGSLAVFLVKRRIRGNKK